MGLAAVGTAVAIAGAAVSAYSSISSGIAQGKAASYQAQVAQNNSTIAQHNATYANQAGQAQATEKSLQNAQQLGKIKAAQAANGVDVNSGSAAQVQASQREIGQIDTENTVQSSLLQAYGFRQQAASYTGQAGLDEAESSNAVEAGALSGAGGLLQSAGSVGTKWLGSQGGGG